MIKNLLNPDDGYLRTKGHVFTRASFVCGIFGLVSIPIIYLFSAEIHNKAISYSSELSSRIESLAVKNHADEFLFYEIKNYISATNDFLKSLFRIIICLVAAISLGLISIGTLFKRIQRILNS